MKQKIATGLLLTLTVVAVASVSPLLAQQQITTPKQIACSVGEGSNAACAGKWIFFAGNSSNIDSGAWVVRIDIETGAIWYKNGKKLVQVVEPD